MPQRLKPLSVGLYEGLVVQVLLDNSVHHGVEQQHIRAGTQLQELVGVQVQLGAIRFDDDQLAAAQGRVFHVGGRHRVVVVGARANHDDDLGLNAVGHLVGNSPGTDGF